MTEITATPGDGKYRLASIVVQAGRLRGLIAARMWKDAYAAHEALDELLLAYDGTAPRKPAKFASLAEYREARCVASA